MPITPPASKPSSQPFKPVRFARAANALSGDEQAALARGADVPGRVQDGPTCGLYAMGMVMDFYNDQDASRKTPLVRSEDVRRPNASNRPPNTDLKLLDLAREKGFTAEGGMFHAEQLAALARPFGYEATVKDHATLQDIEACVDRHHPAMIAFDADYDQGNPANLGGKQAHWAVIEGHFQKDGVEYLVATHGWTGKEYVWKAQDLMDSVNQLNWSDHPDAPGDITETLRDRLVEVYPSSEP